MTMDTKIEKIKNILENHVGKDNAITSAEIADILGIDEDDTKAKTRQLLLKAAKRFNLPMAATTKKPKGYYLIKNDTEYKEYMKTLDKRIDKIKERKDIITKNYKKGRK